MKQTVAKEGPRVPCEKCNNIERFSFGGCAKNCEKLLEYFKKVFSNKESPCFKCGIPKAFGHHGEKCKGQCPLPGIYAENLGDNGGLKSVMGKPPTPYVTEWDIKHNRNYRRERREGWHGGKTNFEKL